MTFIAALIQTLFKLVVISTVAFGGILLGKFLRNKVDNKKSEE